MKMIRLVAAAATMATAALSAGSLQAAQYMVSYTSNLNTGGTALFSGTLTTTDTADANGFFTVTDLVGTRDGQAATLVEPGNFGNNDNLFKPVQSYFTGGGLTFLAGGFQHNPYVAGGQLFEFQEGTITNFVVSQVNGAVPEPATWAMMLLGFGMIGFGMRFSVRRSNAHFDLKRIAAELEA